MVVKESIKIPNKTTMLPSNSAAFLPFSSENLPALSRNKPCISAPIVIPSPAIDAVEPSFSVTKSGRIDERNPNKTQLLIKARTNAI